MDTAGCIQGFSGDAQRCWSQQRATEPCPRQIEPAQSFDQHLERENAGDRFRPTPYADWLERGNREHSPTDVSGRDFRKKVQTEQTAGSEPGNLASGISAGLRPPVLGDLAPRGNSALAADRIVASQPGLRVLSRGLTLDVLA